MAREITANKLSRDKRQSQVLKGLAELGLLALLKDGPEYGLQILDGLRAKAGLDIAEGTLYPLLYRLERSGVVKAEWRIQNGVSHPRKYYALTADGITELKIQSEEWLALSDKLRTFLTRGDR